jgi:hypothetical protein
MVKGTPETRAYNRRRSTGVLGDEVVDVLVQ